MGPSAIISFRTWDGPTRAEEDDDGTKECETQERRRTLFDLINSSFRKGRRCIPSWDSWRVPQDARTKPQGTVKIGAGITGLVFFREFDLFWYKDGILIDVCFGEPPWRFDGLSLTLRLFRDTLIIVPEDLGLPGALLPYVCASNFPPVICWEYMLSVEEVDLHTLQASKEELWSSVSLGLFKMACMKLGSKTDGFQRQGQAWYVVLVIIVV
uniref:Uncharacterized protein n=1 Tax=Musa acuminata TaxID=4641 RepID=Q1EPH6_MUSAC|nr:hypothetical protein MA4_106O17.28 [Musa acuminata]